jgi:hypothetical protein
MYIRAAKAGKGKDEMMAKKSKSPPPPPKTKRFDPNNFIGFRGN